MNTYLRVVAGGLTGCVRIVDPDTVETLVLAAAMRCAAETRAADYRAAAVLFAEKLSTAAKDCALLCNPADEPDPFTETYQCFTVMFSRFGVRYGSRVMDLALPCPDTTLSWAEFLEATAKPHWKNLLLAWEADFLPVEMQRELRSA